MKTSNFLLALRPDGRVKEGRIQVLTSDSLSVEVALCGGKRQAASDDRLLR